MRTPPLLADFIHHRVRKPICEKYLTLPHTVTHLPKGNNGDKSTGQEGCASCPAFSDLGLHNICSMKAPIVAAASSCFCLVAWV